MNHPSRSESASVEKYIIKNNNKINKPYFRRPLEEQLGLHWFAVEKFLA